jgi:ferredoxin
MVIVDGTTCDECGTCICVCPVDALVLDDGLNVDGGVCISCGKCIAVCPMGAISAQQPRQRENPANERKEQ